MTHERNHLPISDHFSLDAFEDPTTGLVQLCPDLVQALEEAHAKLGRGFRVTSGYRSARHNADVAGSPTSHHLVGGAADLVPLSGSLEELAVACMLVPELFTIKETTHVHVHLRRLMHHPT
jgi:uncharacterized protein YcbK (DUF882 family)